MRLFSQRQHTTGVCRGGGLNKYQRVAGGRGDSGGLRRSGLVRGQCWFFPPPLNPCALALTKNIRTLRAMRAIPETDWKKLRALKTRALNDACARILDAIAQIVQKSDGRDHEAYLALWELLHKQMI